MRFAIFPLHLSKVLRLPRKIDARSYEVLHLSRKIILANLQIWCSKMHPLAENQRPDQHLSWTCLLYCACHRKCIFADPLQMSHARHRFWRCYKTLTFCSRLRRCTTPCACHAKRDLNVQNWSVSGVLCAFWLRNVLRATTACTFQHLNFHKWPEHGVFRTFWLRHVLRTTTACTFSTSQLPQVVRPWCVLYILTSTCASRHNGVHFFDIATSNSGPNVRCF